MKKILTIILLLLFSISIYGCSPSQTETPLKEEESQIKLDTDVTIVENDVELTYDYKAVPTSDALQSRIKDSYFSLKLSENEKEIYDELVSKISNEYSSNPSSLSISCSILPMDKEIIFKIINIILLDTPELFYLDFKFDFEVNEDNKITNLTFYFQDNSFEKYNSYIEKLDKLVKEYEKFHTTSKTQIDVVYRFISDAPSKISDYENSEQILLKAFFDSSFKSSSSSICIAKFFNLLAHRAGLESLVAIAFKDSDDVREFIHIEDNKATLDMNNFVFFNKVKLNNNWYVIDFAENAILKDTFKYKISSKSSLNLFIPCTDEQYAAIHKFWITDEMLGIIPASQTLDFELAYRNGEFVPSPLKTDSEYVRKYMDKIFSNVFIELTSNKPNVANRSLNESFVYRFADKETYEYFKQNLPIAIETLNTSSKSIDEYNMDTIDKYYIVIINDVYTYQ